MSVQLRGNGRGYQKFVQGGLKGSINKDVEKMFITRGVERQFYNDFVQTHKFYVIICFY
jgi:hypothetical protein